MVLLQRVRNPHLQALLDVAVGPLPGDPIMQVCGFLRVHLHSFGGFQLRFLTAIAQVFACEPTLIQFVAALGGNVPIGVTKQLVQQLGKLYTCIYLPSVARLSLNLPCPCYRKRPGVSASRG